MFDRITKRYCYSENARVGDFEYNTFRISEYIIYKEYLNNSLILPPDTYQSKYLNINLIKDFFEDFTPI